MDTETKKQIEELRIDLAKLAEILRRVIRRHHLDGGEAEGDVEALTAIERKAGE